MSKKKNLKKCPATDCTAIIDPHKAFCLDHWRQLPKGLQDRIWLSWRQGAGGNWLAALKDAIKFLKDRADRVKHANKQFED